MGLPSGLVWLPSGGFWAGPVRVSCEPALFRQSVFESRGLFLDPSLADVLNIVREFWPRETDLGPTYLVWFHWFSLRLPSTAAFSCGASRSVTMRQDVISILSYSVIYFVSYNKTSTKSSCKQANFYPLENIGKNRNYIPIVTQHKVMHKERTRVG